MSIVCEIKRQSSGALEVRSRGPLAVGLSSDMIAELEGSDSGPSQGALNGLCSFCDAAAALTIANLYHTGELGRNRKFLYLTRESGRRVYHYCSKFSS